VKNARSTLAMAERTQINQDGQREREIEIAGIGIGIGIGIRMER
jgi:hypothetical protein